MSRETFRTTRHDGGFSLVELLLVVAIMCIVAAIAVSPAVGTVRSFRMRRDSGGMSNYVALAKIRAASGFTRARVYADTSGQTFSLQIWQKTGNTWVTEGGAQHLSAGVVFGYGSVASAPPNTQGTIGQASACLDDSNSAIANTACIMFNSRGVPIDSTGSPVGNGALYVTNGSEVHAVTVSATGFTQGWSTGVTATSWMKK